VLKRTSSDLALPECSVKKKNEVIVELSQKSSGTSSVPRVSIGMPVYNGDRYVEESIRSLLAQTYTDFELIISDNGSSDSTKMLCRRLAAEDERICYVRQVENLGAAANFNKVFALSRGEYFKWAAHDDLCDPRFLESCVAILDEREDVVLAFTRCQEIDEEGVPGRICPSRSKPDSLSVRERFATMIIEPSPFVPVFGLVRRDVLARTGLIGSYAGSDRPLIGELALHGLTYEVPELLFFYRVHPQQSWGHARPVRSLEAWFDPARANKHTMPKWRLLIEHERTIWRAPLDLKSRVVLQGVILKWMRARWRPLLKNLFMQE
jgi:glycosyltransferase involved in cell wall biosynthesis